MKTNNCTILQGDALTLLRTLPAESVQCCVTSPPYWGLRDYGVGGQMGLEPTPEAYLDKMVAVFEEVRRVLRPGGTCWVNMGDCLANDTKWGGTTGGKHVSGLHGEPIGRTKKTTGLKGKNLVGMPWRLAFALQSAGWYLRADIIWHKPNPMPESVKDRPTKAHEYLFLLAKSTRYYYNADAIAEQCITDADAPRKKRPSRKRGEFSGKTNALPGREAFRAVTETRNKRSVWTVATKPFAGAHFATFPEALVDPCIRAGSRPGDLVLDPFSGAGTAGLVAVKLGRRFLGIELNQAYIEMAEHRIRNEVGLLVGCSA